MARALEEGELKALVRQLVKAAGGVEACGVLLGISHQRVSQYQSPNHPDQMPYLMICKLECVAERAIVSGAQVRAIERRQLRTPSRRRRRGGHQERRCAPDRSRSGRARSPPAPQTSSTSSRPPRPTFTPPSV